MKMCIICLLATVCTWLNSFTASAQLDSQIAAWLSRETAVLLEIEDLHSAYEQLRKLPALRSKNWKELIELLEDEETAIVSVERMDQVLHSLQELDQLISFARQTGFAMHDLDARTWSWMLQGDETTLEEIYGHLRILAGCFLASKDKSIDDVINLSADEVNELLTANGLGSIQEFDGWLVASNWQSFLEQLAVIQEDGTPEEFQSLADDRAYQTIRKRSERITNDGSLISIYLKPAKLNRWFPQYSKTEWTGYHHHEFPAAGINVLVSPEVDDPTKPMLIADANVMFTKPKQGRALMFAQYKPVEIPYLTVKPTQLFAFARDEKLFADESLRCYGAMFGENSAKQWLEDRFDHDRRSYFDDAVPRRSSYVELKYLDEDEEQPGPRLLRMERINDADAMQRYVDGMVKEAQDLRNHKIKPEDQDGFRIWRLDDSLIAKNVGREENNTHYLHADNFSLDAYMYGPEWYVEGEWPRALDQLRHLENETAEAKDYGAPIRQLVNDLLYRTSDADPFEIRYFEPQSWLERIEAKANQASSPSFQRVELDGTEYFLVQRSNGRNEFTLKTGDDIDSLKRQFEERNQRERQKAAWRSQFATTLSKLFGRQLFLFTQSDDEIRVIIGCYPMPKDETGSD